MSKKILFFFFEFDVNSILAANNIRNARSTLKNVESSNHCSSMSEFTVKSAGLAWVRTDLDMVINPKVLTTLGYVKDNSEETNSLEFSTCFEGERRDYISNVIVPGGVTKEVLDTWQATQLRKYSALIRIARQRLAAKERDVQEITTRYVLNSYTRAY